MRVDWKRCVFCFITLTTVIEAKGPGYLNTLLSQLSHCFSILPHRLDKAAGSEGCWLATPLGKATLASMMDPGDALLIRADMAYAR